MLAGIRPDRILMGDQERGKYRDVILPMTVLRRLDAVLESKPLHARGFVFSGARVLGRWG